jgi:enamine deaminase RidA (YjgF/YER057c/UK114 family)
MIQRLQCGPRMSQAVVHGNTVYLAGQVASDTSADVAGQTRQVLAAIDALLAEAGTDKTKVLTATIYLADITTFGEMNSEWDAWVPAGNAPARATVEARMVAPAYKVEIQVVAAR